ncbi:MAG TPA: TerC/Alx family metal homeostasis membrane protein [Sphingomicrobium sp.]|nr:TerC/Alx family metal homeostasis membrane protein [Sphingomicrobium sp.]
MPPSSDFGLWIAFAAAATAILIFDFFVLARRPGRLSGARALVMVAIYACIALAFGGLLFLARGRDSGMEYLTGYLLELSLSFDNIFIWILVLKNLSVPDDDQETVLFWGILGALVFRAIFIFGGAALLNLFDWMLYVFGAAVIVSGIRLLRSGTPQDVENSRIMRFAKAHLPVTEDYRGRKFVIRKGSVRCATPLLLALVVIELSDIFFAMDSLPAIFGVTRDTLVIYSSNMFAVIGLRALYFAVAGLMERLRYLHLGLAVLLVMIGAKMIAGDLVEIQIWVTLAATLAIVTATVGLSLAWSRPRRAGV